MENLLEMNNISKSFFGVKVLDDISFHVRPGTVHALLGENGAGKSTLMKILAGIYTLESGEILLEGEKITVNTPKQALDVGISMIHQELAPVLHMRVCENIFLGREPSFASCVRYKTLCSMTKQILGRITCNINPMTYMHTLKVADMQMVEIAKAVSRDAKIIIMDEPTSALTDREAENLFNVIEELKKEGKGIIYISHKMDEILKISDDITVLRDGKLIESWKSGEVEIGEVMDAMVGRKLTDVFPKRSCNVGDVILSVNNLCKKNTFYDINFDVREGEVLGIVGLMGAGRTEVMEALFGVTRFDSGTVTLKGEDVEFTHPSKAIRENIAFVTEDRKLQGLVLVESIKFNITLVAQKLVTKMGVIRNRREKQIVADMGQKLNIKCRNMSQVLNTLSGGNQQKVVLAKWLLMEPDILILDEPTRGIDVGAKREIYQLINEACSKGKAVIMVSSELPEVLGMSDRVIVFSNKRVAGEVEKAEFDQTKILQLAMSNL